MQKETNMTVLAPPTLERPLTYDDLAALPDDGKRYELINGELFELTGPTTKHQWTSGGFYNRLNRFVLQNELGLVFYAPLDVYFTPHNVVQPDVVYVSRERASIIRAQKIEGAPDLLMEVLSPSNRRHDTITKAAIYAAFGVREYWLADPESESILVQTVSDGIFVPVDSTDGIARSIILPGFEVIPAEVFAMPAWARNLGL
jgi:Uma2 family endonuclease